MPLVGCPEAGFDANLLSLFGLHDRGLQVREIFGSVRYLSFDGLMRKSNVEAYVRSIERSYDVVMLREKF